MKRALLIAGGTVGGLGAVLAITPPQLSSGDLNIAGVTSSTGTGTSASASSSSSMASGTTVATKAAKPVATKKATSGATTSVAAPVATQSAAATAAATTAAAKSGTFTGPAVFVKFGNVQVQITVVNGKVTDAIAVQAPKGKNDRYTKMAVPILKQQTLAAQSANIVGASGASYTSYGWFTSLQGALADAGL